MDDGWIMFHRKFLSWEWFGDANMVKLFIYLVLKANHSDGKWQGHDIKRGQLITGLKSLSFDTKMSTQQLRTCLSKLEKTGEINKQSNTQNTLITICKYEDYQTLQQTSNKQTNKRATNEQQTSNKRATTNNNENKNNNEITINNKKSISTPSLDEVKAYFAENGYLEQAAIKAFNYYDSANWHDSKGNKVRNWKQKMQAVWFKDENKLIDKLSTSVTDAIKERIRKAQ